MSDVLLDELTEEGVFQIRRSRAMQLARMDAYLDGVVLAAEQVQDIRLSLLETPPAVTGWEAAGSILLTSRSMPPSVERCWQRRPRSSSRRCCA